MIYLHAAFSQQHALDDLPAAVRSALGKPLRRAAPLTQLALLGALAALPAERRHLPTALLWQSTRGPRRETRAMLEEICTGNGEPMPFEFLATQPALAAAQIHPFLPGLQSALHFPLDTAGVADWTLLLTLAGNWLSDGRYAQVLCAHLDCAATDAAGHWLVLAADPGENCPASLRLDGASSGPPLADTPDLPARLADWLLRPEAAPQQLSAPGLSRLAVEFAKL